MIMLVGIMAISCVSALSIETSPNTGWALNPGETSWEGMVIKTGNQSIVIRNVSATNSTLTATTAYIYLNGTIPTHIANATLTAGNATFSVKLAKNSVYWLLVGKESGAAYSSYLNLSVATAYYPRNWTTDVNTQWISAGTRTILGAFNYDRTGWYNIRQVTYVPAVSINIVYPTNTTYHFTYPIALNYTISGENIQACKYSINRGATNTSIVCGNNATGLVPAEVNNKWMIWANNTDGDESSAEVYFNYDLVTPYTNNVTFNNSVYETTSQGFIINLNYNSMGFSTILANLIYNSTSYVGTKTGTGDNVVFSNTIDLPAVASTLNKTFHWEISIVNSTGIFYFNSSDYQQTINPIILQLCNSTYPSKVYNFTAWDERELTRIKNFTFGGTFEFWAGSGETKKTVSIYNSSTNEIDICISTANISMRTNAVIDYVYDNETSYITRNYYFQNAIISNNSYQHINLYLLNAEDSTSFIIKVQDQVLSAVTQALVYIQRYYPVEGVYRTVQIAKTDDNGETIGFYEAEVPDYKHIITKNGVVLLETSAQKVVGKEVPFTLTFTTGEALEAPWAAWGVDTNIQTSLYYNDSLMMVYFSYIDITGNTAFGNLLVTEENIGNSTIKTICDTTSTDSSATIVCNMTGYSGTFIAYGSIESTDNITDLLQFIISTAKEIFGKTGLLIGFFIILTFGMAFLWNPTAGIVAVNGALWLVSIMGFITFPYIYLFAIMGVSLIVAIIIKT
jgi:hypothetical protein